MPSISFHVWTTSRRAELDEVENAHRQVGGTSRGRRHLTRQINYAYTVLLSSQFQGFCRDLHDECVDALVAAISPTGAQSVLRESLSLNRRLDMGNPNPGNIGADFNRFRLAFWENVRTHDVRNESRQADLEALNAWRNAIAHQKFHPGLRSGPRRVQTVRAWRKACEQLAVSFDEVMRCQMESLTGISPW